jgi:hypothetical protein
MGCPLMQPRSQYSNDLWMYLFGAQLGHQPIHPDPVERSGHVRTLDRDLPSCSERFNPDRCEHC